MTYDPARGRGGRGRGSDYRRRLQRRAAIAEYRSLHPELGERDDWGVWRTLRADPDYTLPARPPPRIMGPSRP